MHKVSLATALLAVVFINGACCDVAFSNSLTTWTLADRDASAILAAKIASGAPKAPLDQFIFPVVEALSAAGRANEANGIMRDVAHDAIVGDRWNIEGTLLDEEIGKIGDAVGGLDLIPTPPASKASDVEFIAIGAARGGLVADAARIANEIISGSAVTDLTSEPPGLMPSPGGSVAGIVASLAAAGDKADVDAIVQRLPEGLPRVQAEEEQASLECGTTGQISSKDTSLLNQIKSDIGALPALVASSNQEEANIDAVTEAFATCENPQAAIDFLRKAQLSPGNSPADVAAYLARSLARQRRSEAAVAMLSMVTDAEDWANVGLELNQTGDVAAAKVVALKALAISKLGTANTNPDYSSDFRLRTLFEDIGDFPSASQLIALTKDPGERVLEDAGLVAAEVRNHDSDTLKSTIASVIADAPLRPTTEGNEGQALLGISEELAGAHLRADAQRVFDIWRAGPPALADQAILQAEAEFAAYQGDEDMALNLAAKSGPLIDQSSGLVSALLSIMALDGVKNPSASQISEAQQQARAIGNQPTIGFGARTLESIAVALATTGKIPSALKVEARLEANPSPILDDARHGALSAIASAQAAAGDFQGALATCEKDNNVVDLPTLSILIRQAPLN